MSSEMSDTRIQIHFDIHEPIELVEMTFAMQALAYEYQHYLSSKAKQEGGKTDSSAVKLFITKIESNCILAELAGAVAVMGHLMVLMDYSVIFKDFVRLVGEQFTYFKGLAADGSVKAADIPYTKRQVERIHDLVSLAAKNKNGRLGINAIEYQEETREARTLLRISLDSDEAHEVRKGTLIAKGALESREEADFKKVLMYFYQTNTDDPKTNGRTGDRAVITSIASKPLRVYVIPETEQQRVRFVLDDTEHNPFRIGFIVDVSVERDAKDNPVAYRVLRIHDIIHPEIAEQESE